MAISKQELKVYAALCRRRDRWVSNPDVAAMVKEISPRVVRRFMREFADRGLVEMRDAHPGHWFRLKGNDGHPYLVELASAAQVHGVEIPSSTGEQTHG